MLDPLLAASFLGARKAAVRRYRWRGKSHGEYLGAKATVEVVSLEEPGHVGQLVMTAHRFRDPRKYSFALVFHGVRLFGLDVDPARTHTNLIDLRVVLATHWQVWPDFEAVEDGRALSHREWFNEFLERASIHYPFPYRPPAHGIQLQLDLGK